MDDFDNLEEIAALNKPKGSPARSYKESQSRQKYIKAAQKRGAANASSSLRKMFGGRRKKVSMPVLNFQGSKE